MLLLSAEWSKEISKLLNLNPQKYYVLTGIYWKEFEVKRLHTLQYTLRFFLSGKFFNRLTDKSLQTWGYLITILASLIVLVAASDTLICEFFFIPAANPELSTKKKKKYFQESLHSQKLKHPNVNEHLSFPVQAIRKN